MYHLVSSQWIQSTSILFLEAPFSMLFCLHHHGYPIIYRPKRSAGHVPCPNSYRRFYQNVISCRLQIIKAPHFTVSFFFFCFFCPLRPTYFLQRHNCTFSNRTVRIAASAILRRRKWLLATGVEFSW